MIGEIVESLDKGARTLRDDNTTLELEQASMRELIKAAEPEELRWARSWMIT